jgi:hypothetical protein
MVRFLGWDSSDGYGAAFTIAAAELEGTYASRPDTELGVAGSPDIAHEWSRNT